MRQAASDLFGGNIDDQFAGAIGVQNRAVLVVVSCFGVIVLLCSGSAVSGLLSRVPLESRLYLPGACADYGHGLTMKEIQRRLAGNTSFNGTGV